MTSNLGCIGLAPADNPELDRWLAHMSAASTIQGRLDDVLVVAWEDPSGARMIITTRGRELVSALPSFGGQPGAQLRDCSVVTDEMAIASVIDGEGEEATRMAVDLEQIAHLAAVGHPVRGAAAITALGVDVTVHADADAFAASPASRLSSEPQEEAPEQVVENGLSWPLRWGAESFVSYGMFGEDTGSEPYAFLAGTVLTAERRTVALTGQSFIRARVTSVGFEADVCMAGSDHDVVPEPGQVVAGTVYLVARLVDFPYGTEDLARTTRRRGGWLSRSRGRMT